MQARHGDAGGQQRGTPACNMKATGGLTHFMLGLEPAGRSVARWANFPPTGRCVAKVRQMLANLAAAETRSGLCRRASQRPTQSFTSSRGKPNGRSNAPTHGCGSASHAENSANDLSQLQWREHTRPLKCQGPKQSVFLALGALEKSQPTTQFGGATIRDSQARPMMEAVAISSSSNANDTLPDTE
jgi:hypothetical protein